MAYFLISFDPVFSSFSPVVFIIIITIIIGTFAQRWVIFWLSIEFEDGNAS